jgi:hypothetical protein
MKKAILILGAGLALAGCSPSTGGSDQNEGTSSSGTMTNNPSTGSQGGATTPGGASSGQDVNKISNLPSTNSTPGNTNSPQ